MPEALLSESLVTLDEAKTYLKETTNDRDELLTRLINYATGQIEQYCGRKLKSRAYATATRLVADGDATNAIYAPEYPVTTLTGIVALDSAGAETALVTTGHRLDLQGLIYLPNDVFPSGTRNILITATAGILTTTAEWKALTGITLRWIQVLVGDQAQGIGRGTSISMGGVTTSADFSTPMPRDIQGALKPFQRVHW